MAAALMKPTGARNLAEAERSCAPLQALSGSNNLLYAITAHSMCQVRNQNYMHLTIRVILSVCVALETQIQQNRRNIFIGRR
jgi:hypothetical protein